MSDLYKDLGLDIKGQKYRFVDDEVDLAEDPDFLPLNEKQNIKIAVCNNYLKKIIKIYY